MDNKDHGNTPFVNMRLEKNTLLSVSILSALAPLACCWGPVLLTGVAGLSGIASSFSWLHPIESYLHGAAFVSLSLSFYKTYKPNQSDKETDCSNCVKNERDEHRGKWILWIVTIFVILMFTMNKYPGMFLT